MKRLTIMNIYFVQKVLIDCGISFLFVKSKVLGMLAKANLKEMMVQNSKAELCNFQGSTLSSVVPSQYNLPGRKRELYMTDQSILFFF